MGQITEAIYSGGVLRPLGRLALRESQRVRIVVEPMEGSEPFDRAAALDRLRKGIQSMSFSSGGRLPAREELHDGT